PGTGPPPAHLSPDGGLWPLWTGRFGTPLGTDGPRVRTSAGSAGITKTAGAETPAMLSILWVLPCPISHIHGPRSAWIRFSAGKRTDPEESLPRWRSSGKLPQTGSR